MPTPRTSLVTFVIAACALAIACGEDTPTDERTAIEPLPSLEEVYGRMEDAIARDGKILHVTLRLVDFEIESATPFPEPPGDPQDQRDEMWLHGARELARRERSVTVVDDDEGGETSPPTERVYRQILTNEGNYRGTDDDRVDVASLLTCRGSDSPLIALLMQCGNYLEESTTRVEAGEYDGDTAVVLISTGELPSHDWSTTFESRLYLDPETYLPVADESMQESPIGGNGEEPLRATITSEYDYEFIDASSLAADFFEPASIGWTAPDPAAKLAPEVDGMRVYWLGETFAPDGGLAALRLDQAGVRGTGESGLPELYRVTLEYALSEDPYGPHPIGIQEYAVSAWRDLNPDNPGHFWNGANSREEIALPNGRAVLFTVSSHYQRHIAHVYFETTVILISDHDSPGPYSSREAFIAIIEGLRPFEPPP